MSIEYSTSVAYGVIVSADSGILREVVGAYCGHASTDINDIDYPDFKANYPSIMLDTSFDNWSGSIKNNVIFYIADTFKSINPENGSYDAFYVRELQPSADAKWELDKFLSRFGIDAEPGICIWSSVF